MDQVLANNIVLKISNLKKSFGNFHILTGANLDLAEKQNIVILGHSGTGKSVLFNVSFALLNPMQVVLMYLGRISLH